MQDRIFMISTQQCADHTLDSLLSVAAAIVAVITVIVLLIQILCLLLLFLLALLICTVLRRILLLLLVLIGQSSAAVSFSAPVLSGFTPISLCAVRQSGSHLRTAAANACLIFPAAGVSMPGNFSNTHKNGNPAKFQAGFPFFVMRWGVAFVRTYAFSTAPV